ncbi:MAG: hypothetical protein OXC38_01380 [Gammaproteobacteria bacterium]|nr:hypothetical protein [Gammaproteobacteria bacterium]
MYRAKIPILAVALTLTPGFSGAMDEGFYIGLSASVENLDATFSKTTDNTHPSNGTPSMGRIFHNRDSDSKTASGFGIVAGYQSPLHYGSLYWSGEVSLTYHSGKARGRLPWVQDASARAAGGADDPDWPQSGEGWPDFWTFEKDRSHGLSFRLGGQPDFLTAALGEGSGLYVLAAVHRVKGEFTVTYEGCSADGGCLNGMEDKSYTRGADKVDRDYTAWTFGAGMHTSVAEQMGLQVEVYHSEYDKEVFSLLDSSQEPYVEIPQEPDARETGLRLRLLRYFQ